MNIDARFSVIYLNHIHRARVVLGVQPIVTSTFRRQQRLTCGRPLIEFAPGSFLVIPNGLSEGGELALDILDVTLVRRQGCKHHRS